jgi:pimeloyl-ACP methyl ester carboxylesterase
MAITLSTWQLCQLGFVLCTSLYHRWACWREAQQPARGSITPITDTQLHWQLLGATRHTPGHPTIIVDHSLGGVDGYFLAERLAIHAPIFIYDRAGYGWSHASCQPRTSEQAVTELAELLAATAMPAPYLLIGDSFGSYNVRLFAHKFPDQVAGMVLTDGLHEAGMLHLNLPLRILKGFLWVSFLMAQVGAILGIIRFLGMLGVFELVKPQLRRTSTQARQQAKYSFYRGQHWRTMAQEIWHLDTSGRQLQQVGANDFGDLPIVSIKAATFLRRHVGTLLFPLIAANRCREIMHAYFAKLSSRTQCLSAPQSSHFVWIDQPEAIEAAVRGILAQLPSATQKQTGAD